MIIGIAGKTHSGKTSLANRLNHTYGWPVHSFADGVRRELANAWFKGTHAKNRPALWESMESEFGKESVRTLLQAWGHGRRVFNGDDYWVDDLMSNIADEEVVVIDDVRYPNEIASILRKGGVIIRLLADEQTLYSRGATESALSHPSERAISEEQTLYEALNKNRVFRIATNDIKQEEVFDCFKSAAINLIAAEISVKAPRKGVGD